MKRLFKGFKIHFISYIYETFVTVAPYRSDLHIRVI